MRDRELARCRERAEREPADVEAWVELARQAVRAGVAVEGLEPARHLAALAAAWRAHPGERALGALVLPLLGLGPAQPAGRHSWYWKKRSGLEAGEAFDPGTGFPLVVERRRDQVPMLLVPAGESVGLAGHPVGAAYLDAVPLVEVAYVAFGRATGRWVEDRQDSLDDMHWTQAMEALARVRFEDAEAYARWAGGRLPTMPEWTRAAEVHGGGDGAMGWVETGAPWAEWTAEQIKGWPPARGAGEPEASFRVLIPVPG